MSDTGFTVELKLLENYLFQIDFGEFGNIMTDEPAPLGEGEGPNPARMLAAAVANCLAASLMFALRKFKGEPGEVRATVSGQPERDNGRLRIKQLEVAIYLDNDAQALPYLDRALEQFENFCVVTQSVKEGIEVDVVVYEKSGKRLM